LSGRIEATLRTARAMAGALGAGVVLFALVASTLDLSSGFDALTAPAALFGLIAPVLGYRIYLHLRDSVPAGESVDVVCGLYLRATVFALGITEAAALLGVVAFMLGGGAFALVGLPMHLLLTGALWPSDEKLARFLESSPGRDSAPAD